MSQKFDAALNLALFVSVVTVAVLALFANVRILKGKVKRWDGRSTHLFLTSVGQFGEKQVERWMGTGGYDEDESRTIIRYQLLYLFEVWVAFFALAFLRCVVFAP